MTDPHSVRFERFWSHTARSTSTSMKLNPPTCFPRLPSRVVKRWQTTNRKVRCYLQVTLLVSTTVPPLAASDMDGIWIPLLCVWTNGCANQCYSGCFWSISVQILQYQINSIHKPESKHKKGTDPPSHSQFHKFYTQKNNNATAS